MIKVYNTLSRKKEELRPLNDKKINLFVCGPTVYDYSHLGHARTYIAFDMIAKYLRYSGFDVFYLQNITDVDDKIIKRAEENKISAKDLAEKFEKEYMQDMESLGVDSATKYARATDHITEIISQIKRLLEKRFAYDISDGIYYDISKFKDYGKLSGRTALQAEDSQSRIDEGINKKNKGDFCLWKRSKPNEPSWNSPWGEGRPGWHIEDTAITEKYFGSNYDIHGGARDLIFPHHEAEIAQMEAISEKVPLVKYWIHTGFLTISNEKMSKSLGNFITIKDFLSNNKEGKRLLRFFILRAHYHSPLDYNEKTAAGLKNELLRIDEFILKLEDLAKGNKKATSNKLSEKITKGVKKAMEDDFNTPVAISVIFETITEANSLIAKDKLSNAEANTILKTLKELDSFFGFVFPGRKEDIPAEILTLASQREKYRQQKEWQKADEIRRKVEELGYQIKDTKEGPKIKKI